MEKAQVQDILSKLEFLKNERVKWESYWKEVTQVVNIRRQFWDDDDSSGKKPATTVYDTTASESLKTFTGGLQGYAVSPAFKFFKLKMASEKLNDLPFVRDWLEDVENAIYSEFNRSNFYKAFDEFAKDGGTTGTGFMYIEDDQAKDQIVFSCRHPKEAYIAESADGQVDTIFRRFKITVRVAVQTFGLNALHDQWQKLYKENPYARVTLLHAVYPRGTEGPGRKEMKWASVYIDLDNQHPIDEGGFNEFPFIVWRLEKNSDEAYGRGIGMDALPEILRLNQMAKSLLQSGELHNFPPLNVPENMKGREKLVPMGKNYYNAMSGKIEPINLGGNFPYSWQEYMDQRELVKEKFHVNFFLMLQSLEKSGMTATEIMERQSEKAAVLGTIIGRLNSECLSPLIDRVYSILERRMLVPPPPPELLAEGGMIDIEYMGPLAQAQKRFNESQGVNATLGLIQALVQVEGLANQSQSQVIDVFNLEELGRAGANSSGTPQKGVRETTEVEQMRAMRAQALQAQQQQQIALEQQKMLAGNADKLNQPMQEGSMMEQVVGK